MPVVMARTRFMAQAERFEVDLTSGSIRCGSKTLGIDELQWSTPTCGGAPAGVAPRAPFGAAAPGPAEAPGPPIVPARLRGKRVRGRRRRLLFRMDALRARV